MKNYILCLGLFFSFSAPTNAQMTLAGTLPSGPNYDMQLVDLSISGLKYAAVRDITGYVQDTIYYYNLDYSLWKIIPCPAIPGFNGVFNFNGNTNVTGIMYSSETLFNSDSLLEAAVTYWSDSPGSLSGKLLIINENGIIVDSILNYSFYRATNYFDVHSINPTTFVATIPTTSGYKIYNLPGTLPCNLCGGTLGVVKTEEKPANILSSPVPNPSKNEVKITFTLPDGATRGELTIYNTDGQKMKSYTVDNRFGFIMVDESQFAPGMYYYNLSVNGVVSSTQKMVVIK